MQNHNLEKPCEVCGSAGRSETMKTCLRCNARQHAYCSRAVSFILRKDWLCEACQQNNNELPSSCLQEVSKGSPPVHENSKARIPSHAPGTAPCDDMIFANKTGIHNDLPEQHALGRRHISSPRKTKMLFPEEAVKLASRTSQETQVHLPTSLPACKPRSERKSSQLAKFTPSKRPLKTKADPRERPPGLDQVPKGGRLGSSFLSNPKGTVASTKTKGQKGMDSMQSSWPTNKTQVSCLKSGISAKDALAIYVPKRKRTFRTFRRNERTISQQLKKHKGKEQQKEPVPAIEMECSSPNMEKALRWASSVPSVSKCYPDIKSSKKFFVNIYDIGCPPSTVEELRNSLDYAAVLNILPDLCNRIPYFPALFAVWMGRFILHDIACFREHHGVFRAFPPSKVRCKVYELFGHMPKDLQLERVPRCKVWTELFQNDCPKLFDVGLYFYPADLVDRSILNGYCLLELMESQDFLLRCYFSGAELFVLTSKHLQVDRRILHIGLKNEKFLWGVFRKSNRKPHMEISTLVKSEYGLASEDNHNVMDMDVDMVGGIELDLLRNPRFDISTMEQSEEGLANEDNHNVIDMDVDMIGGIELDSLKESDQELQRHSLYINATQKRFEREDILHE